MANIAIFCELENPKFKEIKDLASYLGCEFFTEISPLNQHSISYPYLLKWHLYNGIYYLSLFPTTDKKPKPLNVDYINQVIANKNCYKFTYNDALPKAMGLSKFPKQQRLNILDGTAGFTLDSFALLLLNQNYQITCLEHSKILYSLLNDGLIRLKTSNNIIHQKLANQLSLHNINLVDYLANSIYRHDSFDIIYLDPMFEKDKTKKNLAKPKENMQLLQSLCINPNKPEDLLKSALEYCKKITALKKKTKIVLKRDIKQPKLLPRLVNYSVESKLIRYDVYLG